MPIWSLNFAIRAKKAAFCRNAVNLTILILTKILLQTSNHGGILERYSACFLHADKRLQLDFS